MLKTKLKTKLEDNSTIGKITRKTQKRFICSGGIRGGKCITARVASQSSRGLGRSEVGRSRPGKPCCSPGALPAERIRTRRARRSRPTTEADARGASECGALGDRAPPPRRPRGARCRGRKFCCCIVVQLSGIVWGRSTNCADIVPGAEGSGREAQTRFLNGNGFGGR